MTPLDLMILLHLDQFDTPWRFPNGDSLEGSANEGILRRLGLIRADADTLTYKLTFRGCRLIADIIRTPLPLQDDRWE